jgi:hypothetical protein
MSRIERTACLVILLVGIAAAVDSCRMIMSAQQPSRAQVWAEEVESCEKRGGVAVIRATKALGRSADLPVCVSLIGTE